MPIRVRYYTDPASAVSWGAEPKLRRLMVDYGADLQIEYVMGGLAREYKGDLGGVVREWLDAAEQSGMPVDPRLWSEGPIISTYPACMAVKAAAEQSDDGGYRYLRAVMEGLMCFRRKLDTTEALVEEARTAGLDPARFRIDLQSHATVEAFGADLERAREVKLPAIEVGGRWVAGTEPYEAYEEAIEEAGATATGQHPGVLDAVKRFGRMAAAEVELVCDLPGPKARAELWQLATDWKLKPVSVGFGELWEPG